MMAVPSRVGSGAHSAAGGRAWVRRLGVLWCLAIVWLGCHRTRGGHDPDAQAPPPRAKTIASLDEHGPPPVSASARAERGPASVAELGPQGIAQGDPWIFVRFTHAMRTDLAGPGAPTFELDPPLPGHAEWTSPHRLAYVLDEVVPEATGIDVHVRGTLATADGQPLPLDATWRFETPRPWVEMDSEWEGSYEDTRQWKVPVYIHTGAELSAQLLRDHVRVVARPTDDPSAKVRELEFRVEPPPEPDPLLWREQAWTVHPVDHWPAGHDVEVILQDTAPLGGPLPLGRAVSTFFQTPPGLEVEAECATEYDDGCDPGPVWLKFHRPVPREALRRVEVTPRPPKLRVSLAWPEDAKEDDTIVVDGRFAPGRSYRIRLPADLADVYGQPLGEPFEHRVRFVDPPPMLRFVGSHGVVPAQGTRTVGLEARWLTQVRIVATVLDDDELLQRYLQAPKSLRPPAGRTPALDETLDLKIEGKRGWASHAIDLAAITGGERRAVMLEAFETGRMPRGARRGELPVARALYQQTDLGVFSLVSPSTSVARVASLEHATAQADVEAKLYRAGAQGVIETVDPSVGRTDAQGRVTLPRSPQLPSLGLLLIEGADDRFVTRIGDGHHEYGYGGSGYDDVDWITGAMVTERPLYRPGDPVYVVGWAQRVTATEHAGLQRLPVGTKVALELRDHDDELVDSRQVAIKASGKYWGRLKVPPTGGLGYYEVTSKLRTSAGEGRTIDTLGVRVRDFRTPTFQVDAAPAMPDLRHGEAQRVDVTASYYFGGDVPMQSLRRVGRCRRAWFRPATLPWPWAMAQIDDDLPYQIDDDHDGKVALSGDSARGRAALTMGSEALPDAAPWRCSLDVAIADISQQEVGAQASWLVHPAHYLAARGPSDPLKAGQRAEITVRAVAFDDTRRATPARVVVHRLDWGRKGGRWERERKRVGDCDVTTATDGGDAQCQTPKLTAGYHVAEVTASEGSPRPTARVHFWVGPKTARPRDTAADELTIQVVPDEPAVGDRVAVRITAPRTEGGKVLDGTGVVVLAHGGVRQLEEFETKGGRAVLPMTVDDAWVPSMELEAIMPTAVRDGAELLRAWTSVDVEAHGRALQVGVTAPATATPDEEIAIGLSVRDHEGKPTAANVSVWAVDEAVLSLAEPVIPDLVDTFIAHRGKRVTVEDEYERILEPYAVRGDPYVPGWAIGLGSVGTTGRGGGGGSGSGRIGTMQRAVARERFETTPIFIGDVAVGPSGDAQVRGTLPQQLSTFRITAIASATLRSGDGIGRFGHGEARTRVTQPLSLRTLTPRVLRPGDRAQLAAIVDNLGGPAGELTIEVALAGEASAEPKGVELKGPRTAKTRVTRGGQARVGFDLHALAPGDAKVTMRATLRPDDGTAARADAMTVTMPVVRERTLTRHSAVYGSRQDAKAVAVDVVPPRDVPRESVRVSVAVARTLLEGMDDVAQSLVGYPYGCAEQTASRLVPLIAVGGLARRGQLGVDEPRSQVAAAIARLRSMQTGDGGFAYWPGGDSAHPYATAYVTWVLELAAAEGYAVPLAMRRRAREYLQGFVKGWGKREATTPHEDVPIAMALHALSLHGAAPKVALAPMIERAATMPTFVRALVTMATQAQRPDHRRLPELVESLTEGLEYRAATATVREQGGVFAQYFDSPTRTDAMVLLALLRAAPDHDAIEPLARGLVALRDRGRVRNTQESAYALLALSRYGAAREDAEATVLADVWIGDEAVMAGPATSEAATRPITALRDATAGSRVTLRGGEDGRLYWRVGMQWTPDAAQVEAHAAGIAVQTTLRDADGPVDEAAVLTPGTLLALDVSLTLDAAQDHVAVDIPLPAGLEAIDFSIGRGRGAMALRGHHGAFVSHEEIRAERALVFADRLRGGAHVHTIYLRATTPGEYAMPPTRAEAMYYPEVAGHTAARRVVVGPVP